MRQFSNYIRLSGATALWQDGDEMSHVADYFRSGVAEELKVKTYKVVQNYANMSGFLKGEKLLEPALLGDYEASTENAALRKAAKEWNVPSALLSVEVVNEEQEA